MSSNEKTFTLEQIKMVKESAEKLHQALTCSQDPLAVDFLNGQLGEILEEIQVKNSFSPLDFIPHFELMTRDCLPDIAEKYFDFYSWAQYGEPAYQN
jgi:hypothetical protein